ncbi:MAG: hypothetical protein ABF893_07155, partial [Gluconacetobacter liquefaciens]
HDSDKVKLGSFGRKMEFFPYRGIEGSRINYFRTLNGTGYAGQGGRHAAAHSQEEGCPTGPERRALTRER